MKEEIARIMKLVQEGKLSPEDAAELIDAFATGPSAETAADEPASEGGTASETKPDAGKKDPLKGFTDFVANLEREVRESVDWKAIAKQAKEGAQKGLDALKKAADEIAENGVNWKFFNSTEVKEVALPLKVAKGKVLRIENPCGSVRVSGGFEEGSVSARAKVRGASAEDAKARAEDYTLVLEESEHAVIIRQPRIASLAVDLVIQLADHAQVEVRTESGDIAILDTGLGVKVVNQSGNVTLRGLSGEVDVTSQSGDLAITDCASGTIAVESKSGSVALDKIGANVNLRVASGDVDLKACTGKSVSIESVSGNVTAEFTEPIVGAVSIRTVNGDALLSVPDGCDCRVSLSTLRGETTCAIELEDAAKSDQRVTGRLGSGKGTLDVSGINGDITLSMVGAQTSVS